MYKPNMQSEVIDRSAVSRCLAKAIAYKQLHSSATHKPGLDPACPVSTGTPEIVQHNGESLSDCLARVPHRGRTTTLRRIDGTTETWHRIDRRHNRLHVLSVLDAHNRAWAIRLTAEVCAQ